MQTEPTAYLLRELARTQKQLHRVRTDRDRLRRARDHWQREARSWKWGAMHAARRGEDAQTSGRAEAS